MSVDVSAMFASPHLVLNGMFAPVKFFILIFRLMLTCAYLLRAHSRGNRSSRILPPALGNVLLAQK